MNGWRFISFMPLSVLCEPSRGYIVNDTIVIEAEFFFVKDYHSYDSKEETGYVGLINEGGGTCYLNSLLQTLYHIPCFRKAIYRMPTTENDKSTGSIPLALQRLFYKLEYNCTCVATKELTKSFGLDKVECFLHHDIHEMNAVLCEKLEDKMKGTAAEGKIQQLFEGHHKSYIECINVDYKSTGKESFYDLQLEVKDCCNVYASLDKYVEIEQLEGDNKYHAEEHGLQDAEKQVLFVDFPPVLQLQLKRFDYDFTHNTAVKINDRYEFPLLLDLDRDNGKYLSPEADRRTQNLYSLHSVLLVHSGDANGGYYYAFIRPALSNQWYKFNDEWVTTEDMKEALEEQYGDEEVLLPQKNPGLCVPSLKCRRNSNAYMLVYIRESDKEKILCNVDEKDISGCVRGMFAEKSKGDQSFSKPTGICFDVMAKALLEKLDDDNASYHSAILSNFIEMATNNYVDVGIFTVPESLQTYAKDLLTKRADIGTGNSRLHSVNEMGFVVLCCALKSIDMTSFSDMNEALILKWGDAIRGALHFGFKVEFLKDHLKSVTQAYLARLVRNSHESQELQAIDEKITTMEKQFSSIEKQFTTMKKQLDALKAVRSEMHNNLYTELRSSCEAASAKFPGKI